MKLWILGLLAVSVLFAAFIAITPLEPVLYKDTYYGKLKAACTNTADASCCQASVKRMEAQGYRLAENKQCPDGSSATTARCVGSYTWCEPNTTSTMATKSQDFEIHYVFAYEFAQWKSETQVYSNGTIMSRVTHYGGPTQSYGTTLQTQILDSEKIERFRQAINVLDLPNLQTEYLCRFQCVTDLPMRTIRISANGIGKNIQIEEDQEVPAALSELIEKLDRTIAELNPPEVADAATTATMVQGDRVSACGYQIHLAQLARAPGTRSDWMHQFEIQRTSGEVIDTLTTWGNQEHEMQSPKAQNVRIIVKSIQDTPTLQADVVFDCNR